MGLSVNQLFMTMKDRPTIGVYEDTDAYIAVMNSSEPGFMEQLQCRR